MVAVRVSRGEGAGVGEGVCVSVLEISLVGASKGRVRLRDGKSQSGNGTPS